MVLSSNRSAPESASPQPSRRVRAQLTPKRLRVLRAIHSLTKKSGCQPSYKEVAAEIGVSSFATVHKYAESLRIIGYLHPTVNGFRSLALTPKGLRKMRSLKGVA